MIKNGDRVRVAYRECFELKVCWYCEHMVWYEDEVWCDKHNMVVSPTGTCEDYR